MSGSSISWAICKSAPSSRQITMPAPHHSVFYRPDALPAAQPTAPKHRRQVVVNKKCLEKFFQDIFEPSSPPLWTNRTLDYFNAPDPWEISSVYLYQTLLFFSCTTHWTTTKTVQKHNNVNRHNKLLELSFSDITYSFNSPLTKCSWHNAEWVTVNE